MGTTRHNLFLDDEERIRSHRQRSRGEYDETRERSLGSTLMILLCIVLALALGHSILSTAMKAGNPIQRVLQQANQTSQGQR